MKKGAFDYLVKPWIEMFELVIGKALENLRLKKELKELRRVYLKKFNLSILSRARGSRRYSNLRTRWPGIRHPGAHRSLKERGGQRSSRKNDPSVKQSAMTSRLSASIVVPSARSCWKASCSAMKKGFHRGLTRGQEREN